MELGAVDRPEASAASAPTGTVTFLFSDIEGSTTRWDRAPDAMRDAVRLHDALMRAAIARSGGHVFKTIGDAFCVAFHSADDAVVAALEAQRDLDAADFSAVDGLRVRMGIHAGSCDERDGDYFGPPVNRVARLVATAHGGQVILSAAATALARPRLPAGASFRDLGEHRLKDLAEAERVSQLVAPHLRDTFPPLRSLDNLRNNLPLQLDALVGRDEFVARVVAEVASSRLVTLLGAGGVGKTRIAIQAAAELVDGSADGVWFVDLAPLASGAFVADAIASALELGGVVGRSSSDVVVQYVRTRKMLIVLDNCEHVIADAAKIVSEIVRASPECNLLATSREPLGLAGERVVHVPTLEVPPRGPLSAADALRYGAVALFVKRAHAADGKFVLHDDSAETVADIVRRLDGIALAIELAAARVKVLSVPHLAKRLDERFRVLTGGSRTALPRQRTMYALISWSWDLLDERERAFLRRAGIFAGGWTLDAAETVCSGADIDAFDALDILESLVDKSLVGSGGTRDAPRGKLLESMRAFALEKLDESGERDEIALRHAEWMVAFCARMHLAYVASDAWFSEMEAEVDNARAAMRWALDAGRPAIAARIVLRALCGYWWFRAPHEGLLWTEQSLDALDAAAEPLLAGGLYGIRGSYLTGRRSIESYERAVAILAPLSEAGVDISAYSRLTYLLGGLGSALLNGGRIDEARVAIDRGIRLHAAEGTTKTRGYANVLANRGSCHTAEGRPDDARADFETATEIFSAIDESAGVALVELARAETEYLARDVALANALARAAATRYLELDIPVGAAEALAVAAATSYVLGESDDARERIREALRRATAASVELSACGLLAVASLACDAGDARRAARLAAYVEAREARREERTDAIAADLRARLDARLVVSLDPAAARALREMGAALGPDDVRAEASLAVE